MHDRTTQTTTRNPPRAAGAPRPKHQPPRNDQVERMLLLYPNLLRCYSVRPIFLGCCVLAVKVSRDTSLSCLLSRVQDVFNLLDVRLLSRIEHQLLEVLRSQPAPIAPQPRPRISLPHGQCGGSASPHSSFRLFHCPYVRQCGAGAGLAGAHGRRATSSLRRRALRRGSGRAPRAAHAGRELDGKARVPQSVCCVLRQGGRGAKKRNA